METIQQITSEIDCSKQDKRRLGQRIKHALNSGQSLTMYIGSCPDYTNDGQRYTFEGIGNDVPLLTKKQLFANRPLFSALGCLWRSI